MKSLKWNPTLKVPVTKYINCSNASFEGFLLVFCLKHSKQERSPGCPGESLWEPHKSISTTFSSCIINNSGAELIHFTEPEPESKPHWWRFIFLLPDFAAVTGEADQSTRSQQGVLDDIQTHFMNIVFLNKHWVWVVEGRGGVVVGGGVRLGFACW